MSDDDEGPLHPLNYNGKNLGTSEEWQHNMSNLGRGKPRINPNDPPSSSAPPSASSAPGNDAPGEDDLVDTDDDSIAVGQKRKHHCLVYDDDESEAEYEYNPFVLSEAKETGCREAEVKAVDEALMPNGKTWIANEDSDLGEDSGEESEEEEVVDESSEGLVPESEVADQIVGLTPLARAVQEVELLAPPRAEVDLLLDQREEEHEARKRKRRKLERDEMERVVVHNHTFNQRNESGSSVTNNVNNSSTTHHHHNTFVVDPAALHQIEMQQWQRQQQLLLMMQQQQQRAVSVLRQPPFSLAKYGQQCRDASEATQILTAPATSALPPQATIDELLTKAFRETGGGDRFDKWKMQYQTAYNLRKSNGALSRSIKNDNIATGEWFGRERKAVRDGQRSATQSKLLSLLG